MHKRVFLAAFVAAAAVVCPAHATLSSTCNSSTQVGNGVTKAFTFNCRFLKASDISVTVAGVTKVQPGDYSVSGAGNASGTITFVTAPANSAAIVITRTVDYKQGTSLRSNRSYDAGNVEDAIDKLSMGQQQLQALVTSPPASVLPANVTAKLNNIRFADQFANIQAAITDAGTTGAVLIPSSYAASDTFSNPNSIPIIDLRGGAAAYRGAISVKDHGALGDGSDDKARIQAALNVASGKVLRFPQGTYGLSGQLTPLVNTTMVCDGLCTLTPTGGYTGAAIKVNVNGFTLRGFTIDGFDQVVDADSVTDLVIERNHIKNGLTGIGDIAGATSVRIIDNFLESVGGICIDLEDSHDIVVSRNVIRNCGNDGIAVRTLITTPNDKTIITDNVLDDVGKAGIKLTVETLFSAGSGSMAGSQNMRATVSNNVIHGWGLNVAESGISVYNHLLAGEKNQAITVANNVIESKARANELQCIDAIYVTDGAITGNVCRGGVTGTGISLYNSTRVTVTGNVVVDAGKNNVATTVGGIALLVSNYNVVVGNTVRNPGSVANKHPGIYAEQSQYNAINSNVLVDEAGTTMSYGIEMNSAGATKNDFNTIVGNVMKGYVTADLTFGGFQQKQIAGLNNDGTTGAVTIQTTAATARAGLRNSSTRNITRSSSVAPVDCAGAGIGATVTQLLDGNIFTCATAQTLTLPTAQGASGIVQGLPGTPAVGDVFEIFVVSTAAANFTTAAGTGGTLTGNAVVNNGSKLWRCRITAVTGGSETYTCY